MVIEKRKGWGERGRSLKEIDDVLKGKENVPRRGSHSQHRTLLVVVLVLLVVVVLWSCLGVVFVSGVGKGEESRVVPPSRLNLTRTLSTFFASFAPACCCSFGWMNARLRSFYRSKESCFVVCPRAGLKERKHREGSQKKQATPHQQLLCEMGRLEPFTPTHLPFTTNPKQRCLNQSTLSVPCLLTRLFLCEMGGWHPSSQFYPFANSLSSFFSF